MLDNLQLLQLHYDNTEIHLLLFLLYQIVMTIDVNGDLVEPSTTVHNLGIIFDQSLTFQAHIISLVQTACFHLWNIACLSSVLQILKG